MLCYIISGKTGGHRSLNAFEEHIRTHVSSRFATEQLYYTILYHTIPYHTILYYTILYYTILYHTILYYIILYYTILYYTILYCTVLYYTILYSSGLGARVVWKLSMNASLSAGTSATRRDPTPRGQI